MVRRRELLAGSATVTAAGCLGPVPETEDTPFRTVWVSDAHIGYDGQDNTDFAASAATQIHEIHERHEVGFVVLNGDTCQDEPAHELVERHFFQRLPDDIPYFVAYGNHEYIDPSEWPDWYGHPTNYSVTFGEIGLLLVQSATAYTSGHAYTTAEACPDTTVIENELDAFEDDPAVESVLVACHVSPSNRFRSHGNDCPAVREQFSRAIVDAVFIGHDHTSNDVLRSPDGEGITYAYTNHLGNRGSGELGIRIFDIYADRYETRMQWDGTVLNRDTLARE